MGPLAHVFSFPSLKLLSASQFHSSGVLHSFVFLWPYHLYKTVLILESIHWLYSSLKSPMGTVIRVQWHACGNSRSIKNHHGSEVLENNWPLYVTVQSVGAVSAEHIPLWGWFSESVFKLFRHKECSYKCLRHGLWLVAHLHHHESSMEGHAGVQPMVAQGHWIRWPHDPACTSLPSHWEAEATLSHLYKGPL